MNIDNPLSKRIKRHVIGRRRTYFAAAAPSFEDLCYSELINLGLPEENVSVVEGGVEFKSKLQDCWLANLHLRSANRILLRIDSFKASSFSQLEKKTAGIPWELYLPPTVLPDVHVTTRHCRLHHTKAIAQRLIAGISAGEGSNEETRTGEKETSYGLTVYVRGVDDRFTVSIDSSGSHLHKRGLKTHHGEAPIRETVAAAALLLLGYSGKEPLIDPMCGAGTFSLEAAMMAKNIAPGWFREFAFMRWPSFSEKRWEYLKRQDEGRIINSQTQMIFASDQDSSACSRLEKCVRQNQLSDIISVTQKNFFDFHPGELTDTKGVVVINPPYGKRLGSLKESEAIFVEIGDRLNQMYKGWRMALIAPDKRLITRLPFKLEKMPFFHGGMKPALMFGTIS
jgi:putative N6-adenine-specific DNA methylase